MRTLMPEAVLELRADRLAGPAGHEADEGEVVGARVHRALHADGRRHDRVGRRAGRLARGLDRGADVADRRPLRRGAGQRHLGDGVLGAGRVDERRQDAVRPHVDRDGVRPVGADAVGHGARTADGGDRADDVDQVELLEPRDDLATRSASRGR